MELANNKSNIFLNKWLPFLVAFFAPIIIIVLIYIFRGVFPFGDEMYLRSDMYHQYAPFLKQFQGILKSGGSLEFNWNIGLGTDFASTFAYYLASPINWIVAIFPSSIIPEIMSAFIIFKCALMSSFFTYYLAKKFGKLSLMTSSFGIFYALSSYIAAYCWNLMWLDCLVLFPLIILGLERLVKEGRGYLYTICVGLCVLSNYYISIMIAFFLVFYFIYLMVCESKVFGASNVLKRIGHFALDSLLGGMIGAICFLPALCTLFGTASGNFSFPKTIYAYYGVVEFATHGLMNQEVTMINGYVPNIYCTILAFALIPLYFICRKINTKEKIGKLLLLLILVFSFSFNIPAYIWHGFHFPNSLRARHSFIYIFLILLLCYEVVSKIKEYSILSITICFAIAIGAVIALKFLNNTQTIPTKVFVLCAGFLAGYLIILLFIRGVPLFKFAFIAIFCAITIVETYINIEDTGFSTTSRTTYMSDNAAIHELLKETDGFSRVEKYSIRTKNDGAWNSYKSASIFSSTTFAPLSSFYKKYGMQGGTNSFCFYGATPLMAQFLDVKYILSSDDLDDQLLKLKGSSALEVEDSRDEFLYEYNFNSSLGYLVNEDIGRKIDIAGKNPFLAQNKFIESSVGATPVFEYSDNIENKNINIEITKDGRLYVFINKEVDSVEVHVSRDDIILKNKKFSSVEKGRIIDVGDVIAGDIINICSSDSEVDSLNVIAATLDYDAYYKAAKLLGAETMDVVDYKGNYVKAKVDVKSEKRAMLLTSIPADKGWSVYVDGRKSNFYTFEDAFLLVPLSKGEHLVEFKYSAPGLLAGAIISIIAILVLIIKAIYCKIQKFE